MTDLETLRWLIDGGTTAMLVIGIVTLWRRLTALTDHLINLSAQLEEYQQQAANQRRIITGIVRGKAITPPDDAYPSDN